MSDDNTEDEGSAMDGGEDASQEDIDSMFGDAGGGDDNPMGLNEMSGNEAPVESPFAMGEAMAGDVSAIYDIPVQISAVLGRSTMQVSQLLKLGRGAVVELDRKVGEAIDIYVNNRLVARGEVVVVEDKLGVTMTEIVKSDRA
jgi:flagellar motor switch protein FliN/FliY